LRNFQFIDLYVIIACPEMSMVDFKRFNMHVVSPHEALMALEPSIFPWESKIITDYNGLLKKLGSSHKDDDQSDILSHEFTSTDLVVVDEKHRELVPIFSS
jgi:diphthamide biosynthesis protein 2